MPNSGAAITYVLIPPGTVRMGGEQQAPDQAKAVTRRLGPWNDELPESEVVLDAFFLSKFELTQDQWARMSRGERPSVYTHGSYPLELRRGVYSDSGVDALDQHPVENLSWFDARRVLRGSGADLPTEAQWEYACRAGAKGMWWTDSEGWVPTNPTFVKQRMNLADHAAGDLGPDKWQVESILGFDGYVYHAPVDSRDRNGFELYHMSGNVAEWCLDGYLGYDVEPRPGDGLRQGPVKPRQRVVRGGSFQSSLDEVRIGYRAASAAEDHRADIGVRPARKVILEEQR